MSKQTMRQRKKRPTSKQRVSKQHGYSAENVEMPSKAAASLAIPRDLPDSQPHPLFDTRKDVINSWGTPEQRHEIRTFYTMGKSGISCPCCNAEIILGLVGQRTCDQCKGNYRRSQTVSYRKSGGGPQIYTKILEECPQCIQGWANCPTCIIRNDRLLRTLTQLEGCEAYDTYRYRLFEVFDELPKQFAVERCEAKK
jgi:hypothetical protein